MKGIITIIIIIAIIVVGFLLLRDGAPEDVGVNDTTENTIEATDNNATDIDVELGDAPSAIDSTAEVIVVTYSDEGFTPKEIVVQAGQTVRFVNESSSNMWVGSDVHPSHTVYSDTSLKDHCPDTDGDSFDQCESGDIYEFTFTKIGQWGYHNHVKPSDFGKVIVE